MKIKRANIIITSFLILFLVSSCIPQEPPKEPQATEGRVVFAITDKAANLSSVTSVRITIDSVEVHSSEKGWTTVLSEEKTYDLLQLRNQNNQVLLADVVLSEGTYQQVRLNVSKVMITDANGEKEAKLPSGEIKIVSRIEVKPNTTAVVIFDFIVDESLHVTGNNKYIFAPVIQLETKENAEVEVKPDKKVEVKGGKITEKKKVGMDENGNVDVNLKIPGDVEVSIENNGVVKVVGSYNKPANEIVIEGVIEFVDVEGGCWRLKSDNRYYELIGEGISSLQKEGQNVKVLGKVDNTIVSICQVGTVFKVKTILLPLSYY